MVTAPGERMRRARADAGRLGGVGDQRRGDHRRAPLRDRDDGSAPYARIHQRHVHRGIGRPRQIPVRTPLLPGRLRRPCDDRRQDGRRQGVGMRRNLRSAPAGRREASAGPQSGSNPVTSADRGLPPPIQPPSTGPVQSDVPPSTGTITPAVPALRPPPAELVPRLILHPPLPPPWPEADAQLAARPLQVRPSPSRAKPALDLWLNQPEASASPPQAEPLDAPEPSDLY